MKSILDRRSVIVLGLIPIVALAFYAIGSMHPIFVAVSAWILLAVSSVGFLYVWRLR